MRRKRLSIPAAILLASLILSAAIIYAARIIAEQGGAGYAPAGPASWGPAPLPLRTEVQVPGSPEAQPVLPSGIPVGPDTPLKVGATVLAPDQGRWWRAEVLALEEGGRVKVHYHGWPASWDTSLPRTQLRVDARKATDKD
jgi:hypothetical protein